MPSFTPLLIQVRLCQERDDWEVVRAAAAALSLAAYHEANAERMGKMVPNLIPVIVGLLPHSDAEVQAHAATALANLAHGSLTYESEAGKMGAIEALLDMCRGRSSCCTGRAIKSESSRAKEHAVTSEEISLEHPPNVERQEDEGTMSVRWAQKRAEVEKRPALPLNVGDSTVDKPPSVPDQKEEKVLGSIYNGDEKGGAEETMDVDAILAATAALANLLCYGDSNSVRLVAAGGIGVLVGIVSSYKPYNLLDFDQVNTHKSHAIA